MSVETEPGRHVARQQAAESIAAAGNNPVIVSAIMLIGGISLLIVGSVLAVPPVLIIGSFASMLFPVPMQLDIHLRHRDQS